MPLSQFKSTPLTDSTTNLLCECRAQKDYESAFGILADTYGFSIPNGTSRAPPPSPVDTAYSPQTSSSSSSSFSSLASSSTADPSPSLRSRLLSILRKGTRSVASYKPTLRPRRRSAPNLRSIIPSSRKSGDDVGDRHAKIRQARDYEAVFVALQSEYGYIIGSSLSC